MRAKNMHAAPLIVGAVEMAPGAEAEIDGDNVAVRAWLGAGLLLDVTPMIITPPAPPLDQPPAANDDKPTLDGPPRARKG